ncbi:MAG: hypothetical protein WCI94_21740 [Rhodospirillales bacterium]
MSDTSPIGLPDAARGLGVSLRILRHAIRTGKIPAPASLAATAAVSPEWLASAKAAAAEPTALNRSFRQKVPAFIRYQGTSAWTKYRVRVRAYARFKAAA